MVFFIPSHNILFYKYRTNDKNVNEPPQRFELRPDALEEHCTFPLYEGGK